MQKETSFPQKQKPLKFYFRGLFHFLFREIYSSGASSSIELYAGIFLDFYGVFSFVDFGGIFCFCDLNEFINF